MNILHVFKTYFPDTAGGVEQVIRGIANGSRPLGAETRVLSLSRQPDANTIEFEGHQAIKARLDAYVASTGISVSAFGAFRQQAQWADLVHYHYPWPQMDLMHLIVRPARPAIVTYHSDVVKQRLLNIAYTPLMRRFLSSVDHIVATSPQYVRSSPVLGRYAAKTSVVPIGVDRQKQPVDMERRTAEWRAVIGGGDYFLFVGVLRYYKGLHTLIEAARLTGFRVAIVGSGPLEADLRGQAADMDNVRFLGAVDDTDKQALLAGCTAFVFPSHLRSEAFGVSLVEAAMHGKPLISCEIGSGTTFVNADGETGLAVPPENAGELAQAMRRINGEPELAQQLGRGALERYERLFTREKMATEYVRIYRELLSREKK